MPRRDSLRRRRPYREPRPRFLIVCEGKVTEPCYFREMRHLERCPVDLDLPPGGAVPKTVVERAAEKKKEAKSEAARQRDQNLAYDEVWCVFDVETHPNLPEAMQQARDNGIHLAVSNPCFELWALLHFQDQTAHVSSERVTHLVCQHLPRYHKTLPCTQLQELYPDALRRARELDRMNDLRGTPGENPSTGVYKLVEKMKAVSGNA